LFKGPYSIDQAQAELKKLQTVCEFIKDSENYKVVDEISKRGLNEIESDNYFLLNKKIYDKLNEHLLNKLRVINKLKADSIKNYEDVEYELYLTPDTTKVKLFTKLQDLKKNISIIESRIGEWDKVKIYYCRKLKSNL
jgi:hypothetical protein